MKILDFLFPSSGGIVREINIIKGLVEQGNDLYVSELLAGDDIIDDKLYHFNETNKNYASLFDRKNGVPFLKLSIDKQRDIATKLLYKQFNPEIRNLIGFINENKIDALISGDFTITSNILAQIKERSGIPAITLSAGHLLGIESLIDLGFNRDKIIQRYSQILDEIDKIIAPSEYELNRTMEIYNVSPNKMIKIYNGLDYNEIYNSLESSDKNKIKEYFRSIEIDKPYILYVGRIDVDKGVFIFPFIARLLSNYDFVLAGTEFYDYPCSKKILEKIIKMNNLRNVKLIGYVTDEIKYNLMKNAEAVIYPSTYFESFGYVPLEAISLGSPAIVPNIGPFPELSNLIGSTMIEYDAFNVLDLYEKIKSTMITKSKLDFQLALENLNHYFGYLKMSKDLISLIKSLRN